MSGALPLICQQGWQHIIRMGQQLLALSDRAACHSLIVETASLVASGQAELWLDTLLCSGISTIRADDRPVDPMDTPSSELMRRALATRSTQTSSTGETSGPLTVAVPLRHRDEALGVLEVQRSQGSPFAHDEVLMVEGLAHEAAIALFAARQLAVEHRRIEQLSLVRAVSAQVAAVLDLDKLARRVTEAILQTFGYYYAALFILEPERRRLRCRASAGAECPRTGGLPRYVRLGEGLVGHAGQSGEEIVALDVRREPRYRQVDALPETRSEVALPVRIEDRVLGVLDVQSDRVCGFDESDLLVLRALADNIAIAVEDSRIYNDLRRRADQLAAITEVTRAVASVLDQSTLFQRVVSLVHERFGYPFVHLYTIDPTQRTIVYRAGSGPRSE
ncbi:MAG: GAF domain-containing protein, partial [Anaerolineales bacterium]|nr:GAF domain-containing protein [Anaerolineales bacterium]